MHTYFIFEILNGFRIRKRLLVSSLVSFENTREKSQILLSLLVLLSF